MIADNVRLRCCDFRGEPRAMLHLHVHQQRQRLQFVLLSVYLYLSASISRIKTLEVLIVFFFFRQILCRCAIVCIHWNQTKTSNRILDYIYCFVYFHVADRFSIRLVGLCLVRFLLLHIICAAHSHTHQISTFLPFWHSAFGPSSPIQKHV